MGLPFLTEAPKDLLERLCLNLDWQAALQDERIFREGDVANHLFIVVRGTVLIIHSDKADRSEWDVLTKYQTGTCFGEIALLPGLRKRLATAVSSVVSELCYIRKDLFLDLLEQYPDVKRITFKYVSQQRRRYSKGTEKHGLTKQLLAEEAQEEAAAAAAVARAEERNDKTFDPESLEGYHHRLKTISKLANQLLMELDYS